MSEHSEKRYFTVAEANAHVGQLRELFGRVMQLRSQLKTLYQELSDAGFVPGAEVEPADLPPEVLRNHSVFMGLAETLREQVEAITDTGCIIKDVESGLVDWPTLHQGREVWLCWKYGEPDVQHWHELTSGFSGRRSVSELEGMDQAEPPT